MGSQVAEGPDAGDLRVGHPAPFLVEPAAERPAVAVRAAGPGDLSEAPPGDLVLEEQMVGLGPHEIPGREDQARFLDGLGHLGALPGGDAERFFDEHVFFRLCGGQDQVMVAVGLRTDHDGGDLAVRPDLAQVGWLSGLQFRGPPGGPLRVVVPDVLDLDVGTLAEQAGVARRVDMGTADESERHRLADIPRGREARPAHHGSGDGRGSRRLDEIAAADGFFCREGGFEVLGLIA